MRCSGLRKGSWPGSVGSPLGEGVTAGGSGAFVFALQRLVQPTAVARAVVTVYVNSFNRVVGGWFGSHVCIKTGKVVNPFVADLDLSPSVVFVAIAFWV